METNVKMDADPLAIAIHEAGHLIVGLMLGRCIQKVSLAPIDGKRGCFWDESITGKMAEYRDFLCLLAGPRAQVEIFPQSVPPEKIRLFRQRIIQPMSDPQCIPEGIYDFTGWQHDIKPIYDRTCRPDWPAEGMPFGVTCSQVLEKAELSLCRVFAGTGLKSITCYVSVYIYAKRFLSGIEAHEIVKKTGMLENHDLLNLMEWN